MGTIRKSITTRAAPEVVWDAIQDVGALHTRLVPGFVVATELEENGRVRVVTFGNGTIVREPIISCEPAIMRLAWTATGGMTTHYNASVKVTATGDGGSSVTWEADFLPDSAGPGLDAAIGMGLAIMKKTLDGGA